MVGMGMSFPESPKDQFQAGKPWSVVPGPEPTEGHYVPIVAYRTHLECVTWGRIQRMTTSVFKKYCDEAWTILSPEMLRADKSPEGFDLAQLQADINSL